MRGIRATVKSDRGDKILCDLNELKQLLSCGAKSAKRIAEDADAVVPVGRLKLYSIEKIRRYTGK